MIDLQEKFIRLLVALLAVLSICIPVDVYLISQFKSTDAQISEIKALEKKPQTKCRLIAPFKYELKGGVIHVPVEYFSLNKTYDPGTLIYPVIPTDGDNSDSWLFSLQSEFECRMLNSPQTLFNYIPSTRSLGTTIIMNIFLLLAMGFFTLFAMLSVLVEISEMYKKLGEYKRR